MGNAPSRGWLPETASPLSSKVRPAMGLYLTIPRRRRTSVACSARFSGEFCLDVPGLLGGAGSVGTQHPVGGSSPRSRLKNLANASMLVQFVPPILMYSRRMISPVRLRRPLNAHRPTVEGDGCFIPRTFGNLRAALANGKHSSSRRLCPGSPDEFGACVMLLSGG